MIHKLTKLTTRTFALLFAILATGGAWAAASLEETGGTVPTTATLAFKGATLSQVTADTLSGIIGGSWAGAIAGYSMTFNNFDRSSEESGTITCQAQVQHGVNVKGVLLTFTQDGANVKVQKTGAKYVAGTVGASIASGTDGYYDVSNLKLTLTKPTPIAVFDGASGGFKKTSINGVTFDKNDNTVPDNGSYVKISASKGALFKLDAGYEFVVGEFTVTNLNESAAANRVLALWSPKTDASSTTTPGVALESGSVATRGVWNNAIWSNTDFNGTLATGISTDTARTFVLTTEDSKVNNVQNDTGTHLFELTGANPGTAVYGGTTTLGLRGDQTYRTLIIGGPEAGSLSAMTDLVITKVVIYASNSTRQFTSTNPTTIANVENPAAFYVGNGGTINASTINAGVTASGAAYVYTEAGATLNLDAELTGRRVTFIGSISGMVGTADGLTLGSANDKVTLTNASYVPVIKGYGTVVYPNNTIPSSDATWLTSSAWAGTLSLSNIQGSSSGQPGWYAPFHNYGSANSTIKVSGFTGFFTGGNYESAATLEIAAGSTFKLNNGNNGNSMTFAKLTGSGDIVICGDNGPAIQYVMRDASEFAGNITVSQSGSSSFKKSIVLGGGSSYNYNTSNYQKQICVLGDVTVAAGKTWTADSGIVVNGTLTKADSTATLSGTITGTGKIIYNDELPNSADFTANTWTGTVEVNGGATTSTGIEAANATQFMNADSQFTVASGTVTLGTATGLTGTVNVNSGATLQVVDSSSTSLSLAGTNNGTINLQLASKLTSLTLSEGIARGTVVYPDTLTTLNVAMTETIADDGRASFTCGSATPTSGTMTLTRPDGTTEEVAGTIEGATVSFAWTPAVSGKACWIDYEMEYESGNASKTGWENSGTDTANLHSDSSITGANAFNEDTGMLYTYAHPYKNDMVGDKDYPDTWTAVVRCTVPKYSDAAVITFGWNTGFIGLIAGETPDSEMRLVQSTGGNHYVTNAVMKVQNATKAQHVYVFTVETNQSVTVYCDGSLVTNVVYAAPFTIAKTSDQGGFQIGSILGGKAGGVVRFAKDESPAKDLSEEVQKDARIDCIRLYKGVLGPNAIKQLSEEFPAVKLFEATISGGAANVWGSLGWEGGDISTINAYSKAIITVEDDATLTLPANITADEFVINVADGKKLTLVEADGGTTFSIGKPIEVNTGSVEFSAASKSLNFAIGGTGSVFVDSGKTINVVSGGSLARLSGAGTVVYSALQASALSFDGWTGTVQLPAITSGEINLNHYGCEGSTVRVAGISGDAWLTSEAVTPTVEMAGDITLGGYSTSFPNTLNKLTGSGAFSLTKTGSVTDDAPEKGYFWIKDVSGFTGSFAVNSPGLALGGSAKPNTADWYGKIVVQGEMKPPTTTNDVVATSTAVLDYTSCGTSPSEPPIPGDLYVESGAQFKFPASAVFPYKLAGSISGATFIPAANYTVGGVAGTVDLALGRNGQVCPATATVTFDGATPTAWSAFSWGYPGITDINTAIYSLNVTGTGTISGNLTAGKVTINVSANETLTLSGTLTADEIIVTGSGTVVCSAAGTLQGTIKGASTVTISYPDHTLPSGATWTDTAWQGTLVLNKCGHLAKTPAGDRVRVPFEDYGNANSKIRAPGFKGFAAVAHANSDEAPYCAATLVIGPDDVVEFNHGWIDADKTNVYEENETAGYKFAALTGTGTLRLDGTTDFAQYVFRDVSGFAGTVEITFPEAGGRKSYAFGTDKLLDSPVPANLVIAKNASATVAAGKKWDIPAGIIIDKGAVLSLSNNSTITVLSSRSESDATLKVVDGASATLTNVMDSVMTTRLDIGSGATLRITDTSLTKLTIPADSSEGGTYSNAGTLDLSGCTNLEKLYLVLGETNSKDFDLLKVTLPAGKCGDIYYNIGGKRDLTGYTLPTFATGSATNICFFAEETDEEYASGGFTVTNVVAGADLWLIRKNGALIHTEVSNTTYRVYAGGRSFAGASCWHEWDFEQEATENKLNDSGACTTNNSDVTAVPLATNGTAFDYGSVVIPTRGETKVTIPASVNPSATITFGTTWSAAVRCTMPTTAGQVAISFGDTANGILGLASGENEFVELFNWTSADGGTRIPLAQFQIEKSTSDMHIYVFVVDGSNVSLYRDGEFIHRAAFSLNDAGAIGKFKVGDVCGTRGELKNLPGGATSGDVDYVRLYDKILPEADVIGLSRRRPFISAIDAFERTLGVNGYWKEDGTWSWIKADGAGVVSANEPNITNANVTVDSEGVTTLRLNIDYDIKYGTLKFGGSDNVGFVKAGKGKIGANMLVVRAGAKLKVDCDAVDFSDSTVGVDDGATLTFDLANFPFETVETTTNVTLIGYVPEAGIPAAKARYGIALPTLPAYITSAVHEWVGNSYTVKITPSHQAGTAVYYKSGDLTGRMTVYTAETWTGETPMFAGDKVNITDLSETGSVSVDDTFNGDLVVSRTSLAITPAGEDPVLDGRTITVADGCTVTFKGGTYGALTLAGAGTFVFEGDVSVASLAGDVGITVADGATLTLGSVETFVSGGVVEGTGTVVLPKLTSETIDLNRYGCADSTVALSADTTLVFEAGEDANTEVLPALRLDGAVCITMQSSTNSYAKVTGSGSLTLMEATPGAIEVITIGEVADFVTETFSVANNCVIGVTIGKLSLANEVAFGEKMLTLGGMGVTTVSEVWIDGEDSASDMVLAYGSDGVYRAVAQYNDSGYRTIVAAIARAGDDYGNIIVLDPSSLTAEYEVVENRLAKKPTEYTWVGGSEGLWNDVANWQFGGTTQASRLPDSMDRVIFSSSANVTLSRNVSVQYLDCGNELTLSSSDATDHTLTASLRLTAMVASVRLSQGISPITTQTTTIPGYGVKVTVDNDDIVFSLEKRGTIFSVY